MFNVTMLTCRDNKKFISKKINYFSAFAWTYNLTFILKVSICMLYVIALYIYEYITVFKIKFVMELIEVTIGDDRVDGGEYGLVKRR